MEQGAGAALEAGDRLVEELKGSPLPVPTGAPSMGKLKKVSYTHEAMIDLIIEKPWITQNEIAAHFGYTPGWISNVLASDAFQSAFSVRKDEVVNPEMKASIEERFRALVIQSLQKLNKMLENDACPATVALRAAELGAKALGIGGHAPPPPPPAEDRLEKLAARLLLLKSNQGRTVDGQILSTIEG